MMSPFSIPESNREVGLLLQVINSEIARVGTQLGALETKIDSVDGKVINMERYIHEQRVKRWDSIISSLIFPVLAALFVFYVGGINGAKR